MAMQGKLDSQPQAQVKVNLCELNKSFLSSCVQLLKEDDSTCLAPAVSDYLLHTMNIINQIQIKTSFPHMNNLLHDIRKLVTRLNGKYYEVKAKQDKFKEIRKIHYTSRLPAVKLPILCGPKLTFIKSPVGTTRKREREESSVSIESRTSSTYNGFSFPDPIELGENTISVRNKRLREDMSPGEFISTIKRPPDITASTSYPTFPICNGITPQKLPFNFSSSTAAKDVTSQPITVLKNVTTNFSPSTNFSFGSGSGTFQPKLIFNELNPMKEQHKNKPQSSGIGVWTSSTVSAPNIPASSMQNNFSWGLHSSASKPTMPKPSTSSFLSQGFKPLDTSNGNLGAILPSNSEPKASEEGEEDDSDEPPKSEFKRVVEEDALYSKRCKLFEKRNDSFKQRGIGVLYINKLKTDKYQVVIRADNSVGTVLLNILLNCGLPVQKNGKNNVLTVDPAGDNGRGISVLMRVKTPEDMEELFAKLNEYKQLSS